MEGAGPPNPGLAHLIGPHPKLMVLAESKEKSVVIEAVHGEADGQVRGAAVTSETQKLFQQLQSKAKLLQRSEAQGFYNTNKPVG